MKQYLHFSPETLPQFYGRIDSCAADLLVALEEQKSAVGPEAYRFLLNNIQGEALFLKLEQLSYSCLNKSPEIQESFREAFLKYGRPFNGYPSFSPTDDRGQATSAYSGEITYCLYLVDSCVFVHRMLRVHDLYTYESTNFRGAYREELVTALFIIKRNSPGIRAVDLTDALSYVSNGGFRSVLEKIRAANNVGAPAPVFTLTDANGKAVNLSEFRGKVVLLDFWFTGCGACELMAPTLKKLEEKFEDRPVVFISINLDKKREQWLATLKTNKYTSPLSVNLYTEGEGRLHNVIQDYDVRACPTFILIDKEGKIAPNPQRDEAEMSELIEKYL